MTIYQRMDAAFAQAGIPGFLHEWRATEEYPVIPDMFAVYTVNSETDALCADDAELIHRWDIIVHLYSKGDALAYEVDLLCALRADGFGIVRMRDVNDVRTGDYHYHRRFDLVRFEEE